MYTIPCVNYNVCIYIDKFTFHVYAKECQIKYIKNICMHILRISPNYKHSPQNVVIQPLKKKEEIRIHTATHICK